MAQLDALKHRFHTSQKQKERAYLSIICKGYNFNERERMKRKKMHRIPMLKSEQETNYNENTSLQVHYFYKNQKIRKKQPKQMCVFCFGMAEEIICAKRTKKIAQNTISFLFETFRHIFIIKDFFDNL